MIELKNVKKTYTQKKGKVTVRALDDVSLFLQQKGMVFVLGKSGSGKSTLLNVVGGLDKIDSGEIIVKGKSTKDFTQSDFDSYRNTFIGFVFQEYNVLDEFTVAANIGLAMELQGKTADAASIEKIIKDMDLVGLAGRKPNTLSGGQKQRVAIARALVKNPEIIMADEPTGALDSKTGKQVLDTLKKLSEQKLVMVVSHDREFAERYADRIIELADGKIISDISRGKEPVTQIGGDVQAVGDDKITLKKGAELTADDIKAINDYLKSSKRDVVVLTREEAEAAAARAQFAPTELDKFEAEKKQTEEPKLIKSRLPARHAFKLGASGLKYKKFRLVFTILLSVVAFTMFGLADTLAAFNRLDVSVQSLYDSSENFVILQKYEKVEYADGYYSNSTASITDDDVEELSEKFGVPVKQITTFQNGYMQNVQNATMNLYYSNVSEIRGVFEASEEEAEEFKLRTKAGEYPALDGGKVGISNYLADVFMKYGYYGTDNKKVEIKTYSDLLGKVITVNGQGFEIGAVLDIGIPDKYEELKTADVKDTDTETYMLSYEFSTWLSSGFAMTLFVPNGYIDKYMSTDDAFGSALDLTASGNMQFSYSFAGVENTFYAYLEYIFPQSDNNDAVFFESGKTQLQEGEVLLTPAVLVDVLMNYSNSKGKQIDSGYFDENIYQALFYEEQKDEMLSAINSFIAENEIDLTYAYKATVYKTYGEPEEIKTSAKVVGVLDGSTTRFAAVFDDNAFAKYKTSYDSTIIKVRNVVVPFKKDKIYLRNIVKYTLEEYEQDDKTYTFDIANALMGNVEMVSDMAESMAKVFKYTGLAFAVFASLLLTNFISVSISHKKKEIGILRALGARSVDVFSIFFSESFIIASINFFVSTIAAFNLANYMNAEFADALGMQISLLVFGIRQVGLLLVVSMGVAAIASFLPVYLNARKRPIDAIRAL